MQLIATYSAQTQVRLKEGDRKKKKHFWSYMYLAKTHSCSMPEILKDSNCNLQ